MLSCGQTFIAPVTSKATEHLWIILTDPNEQGKAVCVNVSSRKSSCPDLTLLLNVGDHPFITRPSFVYYAEAAFLDLSLVEQLIKHNSTRINCKAHAAVKGELLKKIRDGLVRSKQTPNDIKAYCKSLWNNSPG